MFHWLLVPDGNLVIVNNNSRSGPLDILGAFTWYMIRLMQSFLPYYISLGSLWEMRLCFDWKEISKISKNIYFKKIHWIESLRGSNSAETACTDKIAQRLPVLTMVDGRDHEVLGKIIEPRCPPSFPKQKNDVDCKNVRLQFVSRFQDLPYEQISKSQHKEMTAVSLYLDEQLSPHS